jgi:hypothetical protein
MAAELQTQETWTEEEQAPKENHIEQRKTDPGGAHPLDPNCAQNKQIEGRLRSEESKMNTVAK